MREMLAEESATGKVCGGGTPARVRKSRETVAAREILEKDGGLKRTVKGGP